MSSDNAASFLDPLSDVKSSSVISKHTQSSSFVARACVRAASNERRIMDEFLQHELNPANLFGDVNDTTNEIPAVHVGGGDVIHPFPERASPPMSEPGSPLLTRTSSFAERLAHTIPRKWSTLLSPPKKLDFPSAHQLPSNQNTVHASASISHMSPFSPHPHMPPTGAPGLSTPKVDLSTFYTNDGISA